MAARNEYSRVRKGLGKEKTIQTNENTKDNKKEKRTIDGKTALTKYLPNDYSLSQNLPNDNEIKLNMNTMHENSLEVKNTR